MTHLLGWGVYSEKFWRFLENRQKCYDFGQKRWPKLHEATELTHDIGKIWIHHYSSSLFDYIDEFEALVFCLLVA